MLLALLVGGEAAGGEDGAAPAAVRWPPASSAGPAWQSAAGNQGLGSIDTAPFPQAP